MSPRNLLFLLLLSFVELSGVKSGFTAVGDTSTPHFTDIIVTTSDTHLLLFGELRNSVTEDMLAGLHSGIPIHFSFFIELKKNEPNWIDEELISTQFSHTMSYDTLKEVYVVDTEESSKKKHTTPSLEEAAKLLNEVNGLRIIALSSLEPDKNYRLRIKADLNRKSLPLNLHNIIPFVSWWDLKTDWHTVEFIY
jgi:hypothetical protein